jgi:xylan 1,4-beta-xylosidase
MGLPADSVAFHGGFGLISLYGVPKPGFQAFRMLHRAGEERVHATVTDSVTHGAGQHLQAGPPSTPSLPSNLTVLPLLNKTSGLLRIFLAANGYVGEPVPNRSVLLDLGTSVASSTGLLWRIDEAHTNPKALWQSWGSPDYLQPKQVEQLKVQAQLVSTPVQLVRISDEATGVTGTSSVKIDLPAFGLAVLDVNMTGFI